MPQFDIESTVRESRKAIHTIAKSRGLSFEEALNTVEGQRIQYLTEQLAPEPVEKAAPGPGYLRKAAQEIAHRDGLSLEAAYARVARERPDLAKRYRGHN